MGLFYTVAPVSPTEATLGQAQQCLGENNKNYICESGQCCEDLQCCSYYHDLWWFWLMCALIFIMTFCCVCHHRRTKHRLQQQQRQHEINLIAYREACNYTSPPFYFRFLPSYLLPDYEDSNHPLTPPPPYCNSLTVTSVCTNANQEEAQCPSRQSTPVPTALCTTPDIVELENPRENQQRAGSKDRETVLKQDVEVQEDEKDWQMERQRHFTGDSGIEVCSCSRGTESHRAKQLDLLLGSTGHGSSMDFCDGCGAGDDKDDEQGTELDASSPPTPSQLHPFCLYLHTINEQEGLQECQS